MPETTTTAETVLPLLADPANYVPCPWDLTRDRRRRDYWLALFREHMTSLLEEAKREWRERGGDSRQAEDRAERVRRSFTHYLDRLAEDSPSRGRLDILMICRQREHVLRQAGFEDPYRLAKGRENESALVMLPGVLKALDAMEPAARDEAVLRGVFAGNIFDLGATQTAERFARERVDFHHTREHLPSRPWRVDDLDAWLERLQGPAHRCALLFVDNAGPDVILGMLPLARALLERGTRVILTANSTPSLNDITHHELSRLLDQAARMDPVMRRHLAAGAVRAVPSGNGLPLIDLTRLSPELVRLLQEEPADLVVLEGMGRAIESNYDARLTCDTLKLAMIKDQGVADALDGELYDLVLKFEPA